MIKGLTMYQLICDRCGDEAEALWDAPEDIKRELTDLDWEEIDGKHYCPDCYEIDDNCEIIVTPW